MSIVSCDRCGRHIDSDFDLECFIEPDLLDKRSHVWCESCRDKESAYWERVDEGRHRAKDGER